MNAPELDEAAIFNEARRIPAPRDRQLYLQNVCGENQFLLARVQALLRAHEEGPGFLEPLDEGGPRYAAGFPTTPPTHEGHADAVVAKPVSSSLLGEGGGSVLAGKYKLLQLLGEGGMGAVFLAQQTEPVRRSVAVKLILQGMNSKEVLARFEVERQALALMDHPHIAKVLDAGATDSGRPFFVMELVKGVPITRFCDERQLTPQERLELFIPVCQAIQHAHQKGIIHRDIKPSNVQVALYDDRPVPKVIDFGVAKATGLQLTEASLVTRVGAIVGTPEYMSPEQAQLNPLDIDTRSDVYALGVLLYELLTGMTPLDCRKFEEGSLLEILQAIRHEEPLRPSMRLGTSENLASIASTRRTEPAKLVRLLRGDLDWIVMKCLEKGRSRRYDSAGALARDLERYLAGEPILARPPSTTYRLGKFVQRHRAAVLAGAAVAAALVAGTVVAAWQAVVATQAKQHALAKEAAALAKEAETQAMLDFVETNVFKAARPQGEDGGLGASLTVRQALEAALPFVADRFREQPLTEARLRMTLGKSFQYLGEFKIAAEQFQIARGLYSQHRGLEDADTLDSMDWLAESYRYMGETPTAFQLQQETLALRKTHLGPNHRDTLRSMSNLAICYHALGRTAEALQLNEETLERRQAHLGADDRETLASMNNLASTYNSLGRHDDALPLHQKTFALMKAKHGLNHPNTLVSMSNVGETLLALGRCGEAVVILEETRMRRNAQLSPNHQETLQSMSILAVCYRCLGRHDEALQLIDKAFALQRDKLGSGHPDTLQSMHNLACIRFARGEREEGLKLYEEALAQRKAKIGADNPDVLNSIREMAGLRLHHFAKTKDAAGCREMAEMCEKTRPTDPVGCYDVACYRAVTAAVLRAGGKPAEATQADAEADRAMAWLRKAVAAGYKDAARLKQDKDLDSLRERADFRKLVADLKPGS